MRIAHISDLHVARAPALRELNAKRLLGYLNYRLFRGRRHLEAVAARAIETLLHAPPDLVILTGDISQHGLDAEFAAAADLLSPLTRAGVPVLAVAGNHDFYGPNALERLDRLVQALAPGLEPDGSGLFRFPGVELLPLSQGVPTPPFFSYGQTDPDQLARAAEAWAKPPDGVMRLVCGHYPVIDANGEPLPYPSRLRRAEEVIRFCREHDVAGYFCGHKHKRFVAIMPGGCLQYAAPALSAAEGAAGEWVSVYRCEPGLANPRDEAEP